MTTRLEAPLNSPYSREMLRLESHLEGLPVAIFSSSKHLDRSQHRLHSSLDRRNSEKQMNINTQSTVHATVVGDRLFVRH